MDKDKTIALKWREVSQVASSLLQKPFTSSRDIFEHADVECKSRSTGCRVLRSLAKHAKPNTQPPLKQCHKVAHLKWAKKYLKLESQALLLFTDESWATMDGPDGWSKVWLLGGAETPLRLRYQQGGGWLEELCSELELLVLSYLGRLENRTRRCQDHVENLCLVSSTELRSLMEEATSIFHETVHFHAR